MTATETEARPNLFTRDDTFFGVCEALGEDIGIHANWLRLALAGAFFFAPAQVAVGYLGMGLIVALTRWLAPDPARPQSAPVEETVAVVPTAEPVPTTAFENEALPLAA